LRVEDMFYAVALAILMAWLVFSSGALSPQAALTSISSASAQPARIVVAGPERPRVVAEVTLDTQRFLILVGDGPPSFGVAVDADDGPRPEAPDL